MYMNCAPIEVLSNTTSTQFFDTLPSMFVANIDEKPCITHDTGIDGLKTTVLDIPNPGLSISRSDTPNDATSSGAIGSCLDSKSTEKRQNTTLLASPNC